MGTGVEVALLAATAAASAYSTYSAGQSQAAALEMQAVQERENAELARLDATQRALQRLEEADSIRRGNIAKAAASGIWSYSPSTRNLLKKDDEKAQRDVDLIRLGGKYSKWAYETSANSNMSAARSTRNAGIIGGIGELASGGFDAYTISTKAVKPTTINNKPLSPRSRSLLSLS